MALSFLNASDSGGPTAVASGAAWNMTANVASGDAVALFVIGNVSTGASAVSGLGATWVAVGSPVQKGSTSTYGQWWVGTGATGGTKAITVTMHSSVTYYAFAVEITGLSSSATGGSGTATSTNPTLTVTGLSAGNGVLVAMLDASTASTGPSSPWTDYDTGGFTWAFNRDVVYQVTSGSSNQTAGWTVSSGNWCTVGLILTPSGAAPVTTGNFLPLLGA